MHCTCLAPDWVTSSVFTAHFLALQHSILDIALRQLLTSYKNLDGNQNNQYNIINFTPFRMEDEYLVEELGRGLEGSVQVSAVSLWPVELTSSRCLLKREGRECLQGGMQSQHSRSGGCW